MNRTKILDELPVLSKEYMDKTSVNMGNWLTISHRLKVAKLPEVAMMLRTEIERRKRMDVIHRVHARYTTLRREHEKMEILRYMADV